MRSELRSALEIRLGSSVRVERRLGGGDINEAFSVELSDGRSIFVKTHQRPPSGMFRAEAKGLQWLAAARAIRIPRVLASSDDEPAYLALELLRPAKRVVDFEERLGRALASLHHYGAPCFGLDHDNFIGPLPQHNDRVEDWASFYWQARLEPQLQRAVDRGALDHGTATDFAKLQSVLPDRVGAKEPPSRLHGDLWGGNLHVDDEGLPCLIDPAVYGGHREVDLAMMRLFGGFGPRVFAAYEEVMPLAPGANERVPLYQLYPLLVHVNLFGGAYVGALRKALRSVL